MKTTIETSQFIKKLNVIISFHKINQLNSITTFLMQKKKCRTSQILQKQHQ